MDITQVYQFVNTAQTEVLGEASVLAEDLSNIVEIGDTLANVNGIEPYARALTNHIGRMIFVNRVYRGRIPSLLRDGWEFGSILEKVRAEMPAAIENESYSLVDGQSYDPNVFYAPRVSVKFYNKKVTFQIPASFTEKQIKQSFSSASQMNAFISMLYNEIDKSATVKIDELIMRAINNMIGETVYAEVGSGSISGRSGVKAVNLLYLYNQRYGTNLGAADALTTPEFLKFAAYQLGLYAERMGTISTLFNVGATAKFTPADVRHTVLLSEFAKAIGPYTLSSAYNQEYLKLPDAEIVPFWQGSGTGFGLADTGKVYLSSTAGGHAVTVTGVLGVMFDRDAVAVNNEDRRVTSNYNPAAEFYSYWYKFDMQLLNDLDENFVVFYVA